MADNPSLTEVCDLCHGSGRNWCHQLWPGSACRVCDGTGVLNYAKPEATPPQGETFQNRVALWMDACFGPEISGDKLERGDRFLEEALELLQSGGYPRERVPALTEYVYSRPVGEPSQEVGGVVVTLAAYCLAHGLDMQAAGETELARIWTKVEQIRAKQAAKPTGSALPVAVPEPDADLVEALDDQIDRLAAFIMEHVEGEPSQNQGAVDTAIRVITAKDAEVARLREVLSCIAEDRMGASLTDSRRISLERRDIARAALEKQP